MNCTYPNCRHEAKYWYRGKPYCPCDAPLGVRKPAFAVNSALPVSPCPPRPKLRERKEL